METRQWQDKPNLYPLRKSNPPNIINVAASRAKKNLYVVGSGHYVPAAEVINSMMNGPMESRSSILLLIQTGNIVITSPTTQELTLYSDALEEFYSAK